MFRSGNQHVHRHSLSIWRTATTAGFLAPQQTSFKLGKQRQTQWKQINKENFVQWLSALQTIKDSYWEKGLLRGGDFPAEAWMMGRSQVRGEAEELKSQVGSRLTHGRTKDVGNESPAVLEQWPGWSVNETANRGPLLWGFVGSVRNLIFLLCCLQEPFLSLEGFKWKTDVIWWTSLTHHSGADVDGR